MDKGRLLVRKPSPKENAGFFSLLTFSYLLRFIHKGRKKEIEEHDLFKVMNNLESKKITDNLERHWYQQKAKNNDKASIVAALISCYGYILLLLGIFQLIVTVVYTYVMPWALGKFVLYFDPNQTEVTREMAIYYGTIMVSINFLNGLWSQHFTLWKVEIGLKMQAGISSLLYRKALSLSQSKLFEISTGKIVTTIVKDVMSVNQVIQYGVDFILETLQVLLVCLMLYNRVGVGSLGGLSVMVASVLLQIVVSRITYFKRSKCNAKSDQRLQQTQETLSFIRLIKMYRWESFFKAKLIQLRRIELSNLQAVYVWKSICIILGIVSGKLAQVSIFAIYLYQGNPLNADTIYYVQQLFNKVSKAMIFIPLGIQSIAEFMISVKRINIILNAEENNPIRKGTVQVLQPEINLVGVDVEFGKRKILHNIDLKLSQGLNILVGPSGCGKSTLLKTMLEEFDITNGKMRVQGTISYSNQNPWLFPSTLKQNILFGQPFDPKKYQKVLDMCCLTYDFSNFDQGDETLLTDCGANLSRGQQSRINMARALYRDSDIYLLDDCLASLDTQIKNQVFNNAIKNYLKGKLCLLVTHSTQFISQADTVIIMANSNVKYTGAPENIPADLYRQMEDDQNDDVDEAENETAKSLVVPETQEIEETDPLLNEKKTVLKDNIYDEKKKSGRVGFSYYKRYFQFGGGLVMLLSLFGLHIICEVTSSAGEKFMSAWVNALGGKSKNKTGISEYFADYDYSEDMNLPNIQVEETSTISEESQYYSTLFTESSTEVLNAIPESSTLATQMFRLYILAILLSTIFVVTRCIMTYYFTIKVSRNMHKSMVTNILQGCMTFFDTHLIGNVLTRFSKDLFIVDEFIPFIWLEGFRLFILLPLCLLLIASVSLRLAIVAGSLTIIFFYMCEYILSTTRSTQRLSNATLSPVIGHLNASLEGLVIIRAYGNQQILKNEFDRHQDINISANHLREIAARVLGFYSQSVASIFSLLVTFSLLFINKGIGAGDAGLVLTQTNLMCMFLEFALIMWMIMENCMTSVERTLEYTKLPQENQGGIEKDRWPNKGAIKFVNVSLTYRTNGETILRDLNFAINPQEKIGIVGRTGAGKSSIIVALFKLYDFAGDILIDYQNIKTLSLECLRTNLAIIPQDPVIFKGTVRTNIDPNRTTDDSEMWRILEVVNLKSYFGSLDDDIEKKNLSIGQKQLICLARALTRKCKIVILDEATANMDEKMDLFIQKKIRELFQHCTVITVAHRLHTVRNCDRIIVMDKGRIVEFDSPNNLLNNTEGLFYKMVHHKKRK